MGFIKDSTQGVATTQATPTATPYGKFWEGGVVSKLGDILNIGQYVQVGAARKVLEKVGVLKPKEDESIALGIYEGIKSRASNIDVIKDIGRQNMEEATLEDGLVPYTKALLTGRYKPSQSTFKNFVQELVPTTEGLLLDIFLDPNPVGKATRLFKAPARAGITMLSDAVSKLSETSPKTYSQLVKAGRFLIDKNFMNPQEFKDMNLARKAAEDLYARDIGEMTKPIIALPKAQQQRITQIRKGGISVSEAEEPLRIYAKIAGDEFDAAGDVLSKTNPSLLSRAKYEANRGKYVPGYFEKYEFPDDETKYLAELRPQRAGYELGIRTSGYKPKSDFVVKALGIEPEKMARVDELMAEMRRIEKEGDVLINTQKDKIRYIELLEKTRRFGETPAQKPSLANLRPRQNVFGVESITEDLSARVRPGAKTPQIGTIERTSRQIGKLGNQLQAVDKELASLGAERARNLSSVEGYFSMSAKDKKAIQNAINTGTLMDDPQLNRTAKAIGRMFQKGETVSINEFFNQPSLAKFQKFYNETIRKNLGEIQEYGFLTGRDLPELGKDAIRSEFFAKVAEKYALDFNGDDLAKGYLPIPSGKAFGAIAGKQVPTAIGLTILEQSADTPSWWRHYLGALRMWKIMHTAPPFTVSTSSRNILTNWMFLQPLGNVPMTRLDIYRKAFTEMIGKKGELYKLAEKNGLELSSMDKNEFFARAKDMYQESSDKGGAASKIFKTADEFIQYTAKVYTNQDKFFKFANFIKGVTEDGLSPKHAMARANYTLVDYSDMPKMIEWLRKSPFGMPFISFTFGVAKPIAKTLINDPQKIALWYKTLYAINKMNPTQESPAHIQREHEVLPERMKKGMYMRVPWKDKYGRTLYLDLDYILPLNFLEPQTLFGENPALTLVNSLFSVAKGKAPIDTFTNKPIWEETDTLYEKAAKYVDFIQKAILPAWAVGVPLTIEGERKIGGTALQKTYEAARGTAESRAMGAKPRGALGTAADVVLGLRTQPLDVGREGYYRIYEKTQKIKELQSKLFKASVNQKLTPQERSARQREVLSQIIETMQK